MPLCSRAKGLIMQGGSYQIFGTFGNHFHNCQSKEKNEGWAEESGRVERVSQ